MVPRPPDRVDLADPAGVDRAVRLFVFGRAAEDARVPQAPEIARGLGLLQPDVEASLLRLAAGRVLILAPGGTTIWTANPFSAVPTAFRVRAAGRSTTYWGVCIWDALGVLAALGEDGTVDTTCGCCDAPLSLHVRGGALAPSAGAAPQGSEAGAAGEAGGDDGAIVHFGVPAVRWWENIVFT